MFVVDFCVWGFVVHDGSGEVKWWCVCACTRRQPALFHPCRCASCALSTRHLPAAIGKWVSLQKRSTRPCWPVKNPCYSPAAH